MSSHPAPRFVWPLVALVITALVAFAVMQQRQLTKMDETLTRIANAPPPQPTVTRVEMVPVGVGVPAPGPIAPAPPWLAAKYAAENARAAAQKKTPLYPPPTPEEPIAAPADPDARAFVVQAHVVERQWKEITHINQDWNQLLDQAQHDPSLMTQLRLADLQRHLQLQAVLSQGGGFDAYQSFEKHAATGKKPITDEGGGQYSYAPAK